MKILFGVILGAVLTMIGLFWVNMGDAGKQIINDAVVHSDLGTDLQKVFEEVKPHTEGKSFEEAPEIESEVRSDADSEAMQGTLLTEKVPGDAVEEETIADYVAQKEAVLRSTISHYDAILKGRKQQ